MANTPLLEEADLAPPARSRSLLEIAWRRKWLVSGLIAVALALGTLYFLLAPRTYQSKAQLLVVKKRPDTVTGIDTRNLAIEDYIATHAVLVKSPLILERAIRKQHLDALDTFADEEDVLKAMHKALSVTRDRSGSPNSSPVLDLAYRGPIKEECVVILSAIIESYKSFLDETYRDLSDDTLKLVTQARDVLQQDLAKQEKAYRQFRRESPLLLSRNKDGNNLVQERLSSIESKRSGLLLRKAEIEGYLDAIAQAEGKNGGNREALRALLAEGAARFDTEKTRTAQPLAVQDQLLPLLLEEQKLLKTRGERHPDVVAVRKEIAVAHNFLGNPTAAFQSGVLPAENTATDSIASYRDYFQQLLRHVEASRKLLDGLYQQEHDKARALSRYEIQDEGYRTDIERLQKLYDGIVQRLQNADLVKGVGGYDARTIASPSEAEKIKPSALLTFPAAFMFGALLGLALAFVGEMRENRFHSPAEVQRALGLRVLGTIPTIKVDAKRPLAAPLDPMLSIVHRPRSAEAESIRTLRTALSCSTLGPGHKLIQVTSPNGEDGKSVIAANLAISLAQAGKKVLLVDAELHKPRLHAMFGVTARSGLSSVLAGEVQASEAIRTTAVNGLSLVPSGPLPPNPGEILTSPRLREFLEGARSAFDYVILDTSPLLLVADAGIVAHQVDGVLLNVRMTRDTRAQAVRAKELLVGVGARILGVVVNEAGSAAEYHVYAN